MAAVSDTCQKAEAVTAHQLSADIEYLLRMGCIEYCGTGQRTRRHTPAGFSLFGAFGNFAEAAGLDARRLPLLFGRQGDWKWLAGGRPNFKEWSGPTFQRKFKNESARSRTGLERPSLAPRIAWQDLRYRDSNFGKWRSSRGTSDRHLSGVLLAVEG
jgi:hypothetical protein